MRGARKRLFRNPPLFAGLRRLVSSVTKRFSCLACGGRYRNTAYRQLPDAAREIGYGTRRGKGYSMKREQFRQLLSERIVILDGAMGTELQKRGFLDGAGAPEELNVKFPERIRAVHRDYLAAGADIIVTNTFGANRPKLSEYHLAG